jgi:hypothetical protein
MSKKLIFGVALAVLLASGAFLNVQASQPDSNCADGSSMKTPTQMGAPGAY